MEAELDLLEAWGIKTADEFFFRIPRQEDLEDWLRRQVLINEAWLDEHDDTIHVVDRNPPITWEDFKHGALAASLRKLWEVSKNTARRTWRGSRPTAWAFLSICTVEWWPEPR